MYQFILNLWVMRKVDETYVQSKVPIRITQEEADMILTTPQGGLDAAQVVSE